MAERESERERGGEGERGRAGERDRQRDMVNRASMSKALKRGIVKWK
jgi:hypothetical protein